MYLEANEQKIAIMLAIVFVIVLEANAHGLPHVGIPLGLMNIDNP